MPGSVAKGAKRYVDAADFGPDINGVFYASPGKKMVGPLTPQGHPQFLNPEHQETTWNVIVKVTGNRSYPQIKAA